MFLVRFSLAPFGSKNLVPQNIRRKRKLAGNTPAAECVCIRAALSSEEKIQMTNQITDTAAVTSSPSRRVSLYQFPGDVANTRMVAAHHEAVCAPGDGVLPLIPVGLPVDYAVIWVVEELSQHMTT